MGLNETNKEINSPSIVNPSLNCNPVLVLAAISPVVDDNDLMSFYDMTHEKPCSTNIKS